MSGRQDIHGVCTAKEALFNRWCASQQVEDSYEKLKQLILLNEFKRHILTPIKTYLDEQKVNKLQKAASLADDHKLTHKSPTLTSATTTFKLKSGNSTDSGHPKQKSDPIKFGVWVCNSGGM